jgi:hypothetical protein
MGFIGYRRPHSALNYSPIVKLGDFAAISSQDGRCNLLDFALPGGDTKK